MRLPIALLASVLVLAAEASAGPAQPAPVPGEALFVISGRGWGHGVGMSQYGAYGMANAGHAYDEILSYYYAGTTLGRTPAKELRVLLAEGRRAVTLSSAVPYSIVDAVGEIYKLPKGPLTLKADLAIPTSEGPVEAVPPLLVRPGRQSPLSLDGAPYRGKLELAVQDGFLRVVNAVPLESYLLGVVASEVPHTWPTEALKAQAVAARSYALASLVKGKPFDLYSDVRSQVYLGVAGEKPRTSDAVAATAGQVVLYAGRVATTYYFSSSGGKTASAADVFGFSSPYLVSRPDPWDKASPYHRWGPVLLGARTVQSRLELDSRVLDATGVATPSGRLRSLTLQTATGPSALPAGLLRTEFGLRSTWVTIGVLRLDRPRAPVTYRSTLELTGVARVVSSPTLASSTNGSGWTTVGPLARRAGGLVSIVVKPGRTIRYRIEAADAASPALLVRVSPRVRLAAVAEPGVLAVSVRPRLPGAAVTLERREGAAWVGVAESTLDAAGAVRFELGLVAGSYRARVAATDGYTEGVSPALEIAP